MPPSVFSLHSKKQAGGCFIKLLCTFIWFFVVVDVVVVGSEILFKKKRKKYLFGVQIKEGIGRIKIQTLKQIRNPDFFEFPDSWTNKIKIYPY